MTLESEYLHGKSADGEPTGWFAKVAEIIRLHDEAFEKYQTCPGAGWKSSEGSVSVHFGNYWARHEQNDEPSCEVYSYALGPNRNHYFNTVSQALDAVRGWHKAAFEHTCEEC